MTCFPLVRAVMEPACALRLRVVRQSTRLSHNTIPALLGPRGDVMTGIVSLRYASAVMAMLAVALSACSDESASGSSSGTDGSEGQAATGSDAGIFDPEEPNLPGGVRVLSQAS